MFNAQVLKQYLHKMHQQAPLVHCITNDVVNNFTANVLLAIGATPAMVVAEEESPGFTKIASALLINIGTLTSMQAKAMKLAVQSAHDHRIPWVLDPVAFGALQYRSDFCLELLEFKPTVIRGNAAEIAVLNSASGGLQALGESSKSKGPDSLLSSDDALPSAQQLARRYQTIVGLTGQTDYVTDGTQTYALSNGHAQLTRVTGTGCSLSAMVAASCAIGEAPIIATLCALAHMAIAGEIAQQQTKGVGSFAVELLDQLQLLAQDGTQRLKCLKI